MSPIDPFIQGGLLVAPGLRRIPAHAADAARFGQAFESGRDVDALTKDVAVLDNDVSDVDPDVELDAVVRR